jgi:hypothetical protein
VDRPDGLLWRHVRWRAEHTSGLGVSAVRLAKRVDRRRGGRLVRIRPLGFPPADHLRQPPVHDLDFAEGPDHDVVRLEVTMNHVVGVGVRDGLSDLLEDGQEPTAVSGQVGASFEKFSQRLAFDELHGEERSAVGKRAKIMHGRDIRVLQLAGNAGLVGKPTSRARGGREPILENLDRDFPSEDGVGGAIDGSHAAAGDLLAEGVASGGYVRRRRGGAITQAADCGGRVYPREGSRAGEDRSRSFIAAHAWFQIFDLSCSMSYRCFRGNAIPAMERPHCTRITRSCNISRYRDGRMPIELISPVICCRSWPLCLGGR